MPESDRTLRFTAPQWGAALVYSAEMRVVRWLMACTVLCCGVAAADTYPLAITDAQRHQVEQISCRSRHALSVASIEGRRYGRGENAAATAEVHCVPHGMYRGRPIHYITQCSREHGQWSCQGEWTAITVDMDGAPIEARIEGQIAFEQADGIIRKIAHSGMFQGYPLRKVLVSPCYVHQGSERELIDVKCDGWHVIVSTWCPQSDCPRIFSLTKLGD